MSAFNWFTTQHKALDERTKALTTSTTNVAYTAVTGRVADNFQVDRVIRVDTTSESVMTVTVPDGVAYGQQLLVLFEVLGGSATVDVTTTTGDDATQMTAAGDYWNGEWHGSTLGWATITSVST